MQFEMDTEFGIRTEGMAPDMQVLLEQYPRDAWEVHPGFRDKTRQWLRAHQAFRHIAKLLRTDAEALINRSMDPNAYASRLSKRGSSLIGNLHGHHGCEDYEYFPELSAADQRFDRGLGVLEKDHQTLDSVLHTFTEIGNRALKLEQLDDSKMREEVGKLHQVSETIEEFLDRHLENEEELAVPIILHHRLRG